MRTHQASWAFGMAPTKPSVYAERLAAAVYVLDLIEGEAEPFALPSRLEQISVVKGLFNRVWREDQWDWFTVRGQLGCPSQALARTLAAGLSDLRKALLSGDRANISEAAMLLRRRRARKHLSAFLGREEKDGPVSRGWLYILSTREAPDVVKIGATMRNVEERVREINGSTGMLVPLGARRSWRVKRPFECERRVHAELHTYRIRPDREFFRVRIGTAERTVNRIIREEDEGSKAPIRSAANKHGMTARVNDVLTIGKPPESECRMMSLTFS